VKTIKTQKEVEAGLAAPGGRLARRLDGCLGRDPNTEGLSAGCAPGRKK
jgi:hypothetical protein